MIVIIPHPLRAETDVILPLSTSDRMALVSARMACPECGSPDGMADWAWWNVQAVLGAGTYYRPAQFYRRTGLGELFAPCPDCNRAGYIPEGYEAIEWSEVVTFALEGMG